MGKGKNTQSDYNERYYAKLYYGGYTEEYTEAIRQSIQKIIDMYFMDTQW